MSSHRHKKQDDDEPEWMVQHAREEKKQRVIQNRAELEVKLERIRNQERKIRDRQENGPPVGKKRKLEVGKDADVVDEEQFALDDYESGDEGGKTSKGNAGDSDLGLSKETQALMQKLGYGVSALPKAEETEADDELKIYFCSRTHSQLSQFVNELRRIKLPAAIPAVQEEVKKGKANDLHEELKHLSLGSRKNLCINTKVNSLRSMTAVNERCLELQDAKTPKEQKCPFVPNKENEGSVLDFQHYALAKIRDIEDLGGLGKKLSVCPYYATRPTVKPSEVSNPFGLSTVPFQEAEKGRTTESSLMQHPDSHTTLPLTASKDGTRSAGPLAQKPHRHHRRSPQPHGRHHRHPHGRGVTAADAARPRPADRLPPALPQQAQRQEPRVRDTGCATARLVDELSAIP